jgi:hypothetical protein
VPIAPAQLDAMLKATGKSVVFGGVVTDPLVYGKLRQMEGVELDASGQQIAYTGTTLLVRDGTQPVGLKDGSLLTVDGVGYRVRDVGILQPDGLRRIHVVARG